MTSKPTTPACANPSPKCPASNPSRHRHHQRRRVRQVHKPVAIRVPTSERLRAAARRARCQSLHARRGSRTLSEFYDELGATRACRPVPTRCLRRADCQYRTSRLERDIENFKAALRTLQEQEACLPVAAPASVIPDRKNEYYRSDEEPARHRRGHADRIPHHRRCRFTPSNRRCPCGVTYDRMVPPKKFDPYRKWAASTSRRSTTPSGPAGGADALSRLLGQLDRPAHHRCAAARTSSISSSRCGSGAYLIEMANPRHEHEWRVWQNVKLPEGKMLIPGVISHATNVVEHPELVGRAHRAARQARRARERHRRHRLRLRAGAVPPPCAPIDHVGEAREPGRRRATSQQGAMGMS